MKLLFVAVTSLLALLAAGSMVVETLPLEIDNDHEILNSLRKAVPDFDLSDMKEADVEHVVSDVSARPELFLKEVRTAKHDPTLPNDVTLNKMSSREEVLSALNVTNIPVAQRIFRGRSPSASVRVRVPQLIMVRGGRFSICTGGMLSSTVVLTAAHCLVDLVSPGRFRRSTRVYVRLNGRWSLASRMSINVRYLLGVVREDIAVLTLRTPTTGASTFSLPTGGARTGLAVSMAGFGNTSPAPSSSGLFPPLVQGSSVISRSGICSSTVRYQYLCTSTAFPNSISCRGDSGGPLFTSGFTVVGTVRGGLYNRGQFGGRPPPCGAESVAPVYVDVSRFTSDLRQCVSSSCPRGWYSLRLS